MEMIEVHSAAIETWGKLGIYVFKYDIPTNIGVLKIFAIFAWKHMCWSLFKTVAVSTASSFYKKRLQHRYFPMNVTKLLRTAY